MMTRSISRSAPLLPRFFRSLVIPALLLATIAIAQTPSAPRRPAATAQATSAPRAAAAPQAAVPAQAPTAEVSDRDLAVTQRELIRLLRLSPTLTTVVARDPSLLANQEYVSRNNPQLIQPIAAVLAWACFLGAAIWLTGKFTENRRWSRIFKLQSEVHGRLIDKFSSNQELSAYMETEAGKRFLEAAPIPVGFGEEQRMPNAIARVLTPLQIGIVLMLLGVGFYLLRNVRPEMHEPMLVLGTVALMPGLGFIISAGITWFLAGRLGLLPSTLQGRSGSWPGVKDAE
jgi:hypothetical protein